MCVLLGAHPAIGQGVISGTVTERESGEVIIGANVLLIGTQRGAATNTYGFFSIPDVPPGSRQLRISAVGYKTDTITVELREGTPQRLDVELVQSTILIGEVTVEAERVAADMEEMSTIDLPMTQVFRLPSLGGEPDIFRSLQLLPGVQSSSEISSGLNIRGSSPDQNLVLLDDMILYNPYHLGGFLSTFNADAINHVRLIKGAMPAKYGGRLSSVIDVAMKEGAKDRLHGSGGISMIDARLTLEGPITDDATFMVSGRRVYADALISALSEESFPYYFYDLVAKTNVKLGQDDRLFFSGFFGRDVLSEPDGEDDFESSWGNTAFNLRWTHILEENLFSNVSFIVSDYTFRTEYEEYYESGASFFKAVSGIMDYTLRTEFEYFPSSDHSITAGTELFLHEFTSEASSQESEFGELEADLPRHAGTEFSLYAQDEWQISERLKANIGGRLFYFDRGQYFRAEPRFSAFYSFDDGLTLKGAVIGANQFLHLVTRNDLSLPTDMWFPSTSRLQPSFGMQYVLGASKPVFDGGYTLSVEGYYKSMSDLLEFKNNAIFSILAPLERELTSGDGEAYGAEFFLRKNAGAFTGWLSYTLAWSERTFPELNNGEPFPPRYDKRHDISAVLNYRLGHSWEFTATWVYSTGQAYTMPTAIYQLDGYHQYLYTTRNGYRLPSYHRLDLNFSHSFVWFGWDWKASINIYNTYSRMNPFAQWVEREYNSDGSRSHVIKQGTLLPFVPTFGLHFNF
ncbi:MAG: hypothetical protein CL946_13475 [Ectothiorhodospiraceae bacterium]|nr:hypothetical protein [Ectothiorhodospiraceae bacterium]